MCVCDLRQTTTTTLIAKNIMVKVAGCYCCCCVVNGKRVWQDVDDIKTNDLELLSNQTFSDK